MKSGTTTNPLPFFSNGYARKTKINRLANTLLDASSHEWKGITTIYKNVLSYPTGTDHFKYFEKIPHPERLSPELQGIYESQPGRDLNPKLALMQMEFERVKSKLESNLSDIDIKIMRLPEILEEMKTEINDGEFKTSYEHLCRSFYNYFTSSLHDGMQPDIMWIDYDFAVNYRPARVALRDLKENLLNSKAQGKLIEKLKEMGVFGEKKINFYFWNTSPYNWSEISYQSRSVKYSKIIDGFTTLMNPGLPAQYVALGDFTINALPEGYVEPLGNGIYNICVQKVYLFINDMFNFENWSYLGFWNLNSREDRGPLSPYFVTHLFNGDFENFRRHGYGKYFPVLSKLHEIEEFMPQCIPYKHQ